MTWYKYFDTLLSGLAIGCLIGISLGVVLASL
jgi:hypothetical protein